MTYNEDDLGTGTGCLAWPIDLCR